MKMGEHTFLDACQRSRIAVSAGRAAEETQNMPGQNGSSGQNGSNGHPKMTEVPYAVAGLNAAIVSPATSLSFSDVFASVSRHRGKVIAFGCAMIAFAIVVSAIWPKTYRSEAKLYVRLGRENVGLDATTSLGKEISGLQISREEELNTVVELLRSRSLLEKVVDSVGPETILNPNNESGENRPPSLLTLAQLTLRKWAHQLTNDVPMTPRERAIITLRQQLDMQNVRKTDVILVAHEGPSAQASQRIVSTLINLYMDEHVRMSRSPHAHAFLAEQASSIKKQLVQRETELKTFKDQTGLASPVEQRQTLVTQIGRLEDDLKTTLTAIEATEAESREILAEQGRASAVDGKSHEELRMMLLREKPALASQRAKSALLRKQLADTKEQLKVLNGNENRISQMQREAQILEVSYRKYSEGLEQARLDESLENQRISNINVAQPATLSLQPVKPQRSLFLMAGLLMAIVGGPTLAVLYDAYRSPSKASHRIEYRLDTPALAPAAALADARPIGV
jgi:polysaccharide biosynthesis protein PslE